jgi:hypothetical protein
VDRAAILESGEAFAIREATAVHDERAPRPFSETELAAASARLAKERDAGDAVEFLAVLEALARSKDAGARAKVVDVLGDPSYPLSSVREGIYQNIESWLRDGDAPPGTAAAARRRIDAIRAAGRGDDPTYALLNMVARHGDAEDLAWLATMAASRGIGAEAVDALTRVLRAETVPFVAKLVADGVVRGDDLVEYARCSPVPAWELVAPIARGLNSGAPLPRGMDAWTILRAYGAAAPDSALAEVRHCLTGLRTIENRVCAVAAVQSLADRKIDVASFQPILDAPIELLAQPGEIDAARGNLCTFCIQTHRVAWSVRAAEALEAAAPRAGKRSEAFRDLAREIRAVVENPWRRK